MDVLKVNREQVEHRTEGRHEKTRDRDSYSKVVVGDETRRHERVATAPLNDDESPQQDEAHNHAGDDAWRPPAERRALDQGEHERRHTEGRAERARQVEGALHFGLAIASDQWERQ